LAAAGVARYLRRIHVRGFRDELQHRPQRGDGLRDVFIRRAQQRLVLLQQPTVLVGRDQRVGQRFGRGRRCQRSTQKGRRGKAQHRVSEGFSHCLASASHHMFTCSPDHSAFSQAFFGPARNS
jgi:hypothetical protein